MTTAKAMSSPAKALALETLPTPQQMQEFWSQLCAGKVTRTRMQEFLRPNGMFGASSLLERLPALQRFEEVTKRIQRVFPHQWKAVAEVVLPYHDPLSVWSPRFPNYGLIETMCQALSRKATIEGHAIITRTEVVAESFPLQESLAVMLDSLDPELEDGLQESDFEWLLEECPYLAGSTSEKVTLCQDIFGIQSPRYCYVGRYVKELAIFFPDWQSAILDHPFTWTQEAVGGLSTLRDFLAGIIGKCFTYAGVAAIVGNPLLQILAEAASKGNFPLGLDHENRLLVLCATH